MINAMLYHRVFPMSASHSELMDLARKASRNAYAPYSGVRVGAAALAPSGKVFTGCNIENASYGLTMCAERVAIQNAVSAGEREILAVAVFSPDIHNITPCGACRQVMAQFAPKKGKALVILDAPEGMRAVPLSFLLPETFGGSNKKL